MACFSLTAHGSNRGIHADVIVYSFAHLHTALRKEGNMLDINWLQVAKELVKLDTGWNLIPGWNLANKVSFL